MALIDRIENRTPPPTSTRWMDGARALAIVAVVAIHNLAATVESGPDVGDGAGWWTATVIDSAARWAVPVFIMISGALALDPARGVQPRDFLIKRIYRIGIPLVVWTAIYVWFRLVVLSGSERGWDPVTAVLRGSPFVQLYFLYVLAGLALLTPFMRLLSAHGSRRLQLGTAAILLGIGMSDFLVSVVFGVGELNLATRFVPMMGYYVLGWVLRDVIVTGARLAATWAVFAATIAIAILYAGFGPGETPWVPVFDYLSPVVALMSICAYLLLHAHLMRPHRLLEILYPLSFGVFLLHALPVFGLRPEFGGVPHDLGPVLFHGIVLTIVYTIVCAGLTWIAIRIPFVRAAFGAASPPRRPEEDTMSTTLRAVVTGASSGIGAATVRHLRSQGWEVFAAARRLDRLEALAAETGAVPVRVDVTDPEDLAELARIAGAEGPVHALVANAGGAAGVDPIETADPEQWQWMYDVNVLGVLRTVQALLPALEASGRGDIVIMSSTAGFVTYEGGAGYSAAKHGAHAIAGTLRLELAGRPVRVIEIAPGMVRTEEFSLNRLGGDAAAAEQVYDGVEHPLTADDIADAIAWTLSRPHHVNIDLLVMRPIAQAAQHKVARHQGL